MLMNEAESKTTDGSANPQALYAFTRDMSELVKSSDQNHLITLGTTGGGQPGISGENYEKLHGLNTIDFLDFHDYGADDKALPGSAGETVSSDTLSAAMDVAKELNKPILVGETGMTACGSYEGTQPETVQSRAQKFDAKLNAFFKNGGAGYLIWVWDPTSDCSYDFTSDDPLNAVLAGTNRKLWIEDFLRGVV
jgi:mannan endo-1,4-beta-mannosidase